MMITTMSLSFLRDSCGKRRSLACRLHRVFARKISSSSVRAPFHQSRWIIEKHRKQNTPIELGRHHHRERPSFVRKICYEKESKAKRKCRKTLPKGGHAWNCGVLMTAIPAIPQKCGSSRRKWWWIRREFVCRFRPWLVCMILSLEPYRFDIFDPV
jgi:hypothetical protein